MAVGDKTIKSHEALPAEAICKGQEFIPEGFKFFYFGEASPNDDIEGNEILITGDSYSIGYNKYDLSSGYALKAILTPSNMIVPKLRKAVGSETGVIKSKRGNAINDYWPVLVRTW